MNIHPAERKLLNGNKSIIGVDEVGRGAWAGPLFLAGVFLNPKNLNTLKKRIRLRKIKDSKKLSSGQREEIFKILNEITFFRTYSIKPKTIDKIGLSKSIEKALKTLTKKFPKADFIFLDGGLKLLKGYNWKSVVKGDENFISIALASIVAKVKRDNYMRRASKTYPQYGFEIHRGYGTKKHFKALKRYGKSEIHRISYKPVFESLSFKERVYYIVQKIPKGKTLTYKEVAILVGKPKAYRAVGNVLNKNNNPKIPCHRVIKSDKTLGSYNKGAKRKEKLLKKEGIVF